MRTTLPQRFSPDQHQRGGAAAMATWAQVEVDLPAVAATMRAYLDQIAVVLRPGSVDNADLCLRSFATYLLGHHREVTCVRDIARTHIEGYKPWLAARPGQNKPAASPATIAHRLGTLRMFFLRIEEWAWPDAPPRVPMFPGDVPKQRHALPKALDDHAAAALLKAAQADRRARRGDGGVHRCASHRPDRRRHRRATPTGCTSRSASCTRTATCGAWSSWSPPTGPRTSAHQLLLPRERGTAQDRHSVTRMINRAGAAAGLGHRCATPWPPKPSTA
jgi:hypothetical protein